MLEKVYSLGNRTAKKVGPIIKDENIHYMHMVLPYGDKLHTHYTNATVYMTVNKGTLSLSLEDNEFNDYEQGTVLKIPFNTKMDAQNHNKEILELIVVKAPAPKN